MIIIEEVTLKEVAAYLAKSKAKDVQLTRRPKHLGKRCWWYTGAELPNYKGKIYGIAVAGFSTLRKWGRSYSYIIKTNKGLRRAEFPLG